MITVNGRPVDAGANPTIAELLAGIDIDPARTGIAVAVDAEVARRGDWATRRVPDGAHVEIVTATQGG